MKFSRLSPDWITVIVIGLEIVVGPEHAMAQRPLGIDVSSYHPGIDWASVKASGVTWTFAKAAEGTATDGWIGQDPVFTYNEANAKAAGVLIGPYYYAH